MHNQNSIDEILGENDALPLKSVKAETTGKSKAHIKELESVAKEFEDAGNHEQAEKLRQTIQTLKNPAGK